MSADQNKTIYRQFIQGVFNKGRLDLIDKLLSESYVYHDAPPDTPNGREGIKQIVPMFRSAFPDLEITIDDQVAEGDKVSSRTTMRGTHKGEIFGIPPTGKSVAMTGMTMVRVSDGHLVES